MCHQPQLLMRLRWEGVFSAPELEISLDNIAKPDCFIRSQVCNPSWLCRACLIGRRLDAVLSAVGCDVVRHRS